MMTKRLLRIEAADGETALGLWEMPPIGKAIHPPVLLVHGATFGAALFDLPLAGYSLMQELARGGRFVYAIDVRGYGASNGNGVMNSPPAAHPPFSRARLAIEDIGVAVSEIQRRQSVQAIDLVGFPGARSPQAGTRAGTSPASAGWCSMRRCLPRRT
jgi:pimeloyl-ACP methyl ester carboxylesterase